MSHIHGGAGGGGGSGGSGGRLPMQCDQRGLRTLLTLGELDTVKGDGGSMCAAIWIFLICSRLFNNFFHEDQFNNVFIVVDCSFPGNKPCKNKKKKRPFLFEFAVPTL